jgi:hypothetical protein
LSSREDVEAPDTIQVAGSRDLGLLIGIVKKNAITLIDFALDAERRRGMPTGHGWMTRIADDLTHPEAVSL